MAGNGWRMREGASRGTSVLLLFSLFLSGALAGTLFVTLRHLSAKPAASTNTSAQPRDGIVPVTYDGEQGGGAAGDQTNPSPPATTGNVAQQDDEVFAGRRNAITRAAEKAGPCVVTVAVMQTQYVRQRGYADPFDLFFNNYLPGVVYERNIPGMGSGFIVDPGGLILTNEHVVRQASEIKVILNDGRTLNAKLLGADPNYDLAVLKVEEAGLPSAEVGDSDDLVVGEWAIAIGNPFGFYINDRKPTVTVGVVSAIHRDVKGGEDTQAIYKDMLQTDAAINPGNSGGPLVNSLGQVIGINTFIFTQGGGSLGIGFAIPINTAVRVAKDIAKYGRGNPFWIGIYAQPISPWVAAQLGLKDTQGLVATRIEKGSPAEKAGLREMDVIREVNDKQVSNPQEAIRTIFDTRVGEIVTFTVQRGGRSLKIPVQVAAAPNVRH
jgi:serine protease Do